MDANLQEVETDSEKTIVQNQGGPSIFLNGAVIYIGAMKKYLAMSSDAHIRRRAMRMGHSRKVQDAIISWVHKYKERY